MNTMRMEGACPECGTTIKMECRFGIENDTLTMSDVRIQSRDWALHGKDCTIRNKLKEFKENDC